MWKMGKNITIRNGLLGWRRSVLKAMLSIYDEIKNKPELLHNAPHTQQDIINWKYDYSIEEACYPLGEPQVNKKFWPTVNRVNDLYGDKLFY